MSCRMKKAESKEYRQAKRRSRKEVNECLGVFMLVLLTNGVLLFIVLSNSAPSLFASHESEVGRRNLELFPTKSESCEGYHTSLAIPSFILTMYSFIGLAVVTDEYFEPTLAIISEDLKLSPDVAGATFMAAGSSAPELVISVVDAFVSKANVGVGTILGSAMFNQLVIIGGSALVGRNKVDGGALLVHWYPLARDSIFYTVSLILLCYFLLNDGRLCVLATDFFHVVEYDEGRHSFARYLNNTRQLPQNETLLDEDDNVQCFVGVVSTFEAFALTFCYGVYVWFMRNDKHVQGWLQRKASRCFSHKTAPAGELQVHGEVDEEEFSKEEEKFPPNPLSSSFPASLGGKFYHVLAFPFRMMFYYTIPTGMTNGVKKDLVLFCVNIGWITILTFGMVYVGTFTGCLIGVSPFLVGVLLLAIGTSVPDALASFIVARDGHGDMAISNALGSNVFNIFLGLGLPWFLSSLTFPGQINFAGTPKNGNLVATNGLVSGLIMLLSGTLMLLVSLVIFQWRLKKSIAALLLAYFAIFAIVVILTNSCMIEACIELECRDYSREGNTCDFEPIM